MTTQPPLLSRSRARAHMPTGQREPAATGQRGSHAGIVVLNSRGKCLYRWVSVDGHGDPVLPPTVDVPE